MVCYWSKIRYGVAIRPISERRYQRDGAATVDAAELRDEHSERLVALRWDDEVEGEFPVELRVEVENRRGMIAVLATRINSMDVNIEKISTEDKDYQFTYVDLVMSVKNRVHLARIMKRIRTAPSVRRVSRAKN